MGARDTEEEEEEKEEEYRTSHGSHPSLAYPTLPHPTPPHPTPSRIESHPRDAHFPKELLIVELVGGGEGGFPFVQCAGGGRRRRRRREEDVGVVADQQIRNPATTNPNTSHNTATEP